MGKESNISIKLRATGVIFGMSGRALVNRANGELRYAGILLEGGLRYMRAETDLEQDVVRSSLGFNYELLDRIRKNTTQVLRLTPKALREVWS